MIRSEFGLLVLIFALLRCAIVFGHRYGAGRHGEWIFYWARKK